MKTLFAIILILFFALRCSEFNNKIHAQEFINNDSLITITISSVGDIMCHSVQYNYARVNADSFNFSPVYREIKKYFLESDFTIGNLETVTAGKPAGYSGYPFFNTPDDFVTALKESGFDLLTTANNHSLDQGEKGLLRTIKIINENNLHYNGTYISQEDRDSIRIFDIKGIKIAFLAFTYGTNGIPIPKGKDYLVNLINYNLIKNDIQKAKQEEIDLILVHFHFGEEYKREPDKFQRDVVDSTIKYGSDIIIGGHPHVIQPVKYFKTNNANLDTGFASYSLGNFISNQQWRYSDAGVILNLEITKNFTTDSIFISNVNYIPTWVFKGETGLGREYIILPSESSLNNLSYNFLSKPDLAKMKEAFNDTKEIMNKYIKIPVKTIID